MARRGKTPVRGIRVDQATWDAAQRAADDRNEDLPDVIRAFLKRYAKTARTVRTVNAAAECTCVFSCADDPATACSLSGEFHTHPNDRTGVFGPCPVHPDAPATA